MAYDTQLILDRIDKLSHQIQTVDDRLSNQIQTVDDRLSNQIQTVNEKLSRKLEGVESKLSREIGQVKTAVMEMSEDIEAILDMYKDQHLRLHKLENRFKAAKSAAGQ